MKISELLSTGAIDRAMQIPVAIDGENRRLSLGQILDALATSVVPFGSIRKEAVTNTQMATTTSLNFPVVFYEPDGKFYAMLGRSTVVSGVLVFSITFYQNFPSRSLFYGEDNKPRQDCLYVASDGRTYYYNGSALISAGLTDAQAEQLVKLTPQEVESETVLQNMEAAGLIVPGQIYYIPENE